MKSRGVIGAAPGLLWPAVLLLALSACVSDLTAIKDMQADINVLKQDSFQMRRDVQETRSAVASLKEEVAASGQLSGEASLEAIRKSQETLFDEVSGAAREMQLLNGRLDEHRFYVDRRLEEMSSEMESLRTGLQGAAPSAEDRAALAELKARVQRLDAEVARLKERGAAPSPPAPAATAEEPAAASTPEAMYEQALRTFKEKRYAKARGQMQEFLRKHPEHLLAGNAQFWIAETYFAEKDYDDAILAYEEVLQQHGDSRKVPAAMLKQAHAFLELGDRKAARGILQELIGRYPDSEQAQTATRDLERLQ